VALEGETRLRFFDGFALLWQGGLALYCLLPAWGPVFVTPGTFEPLLEHMPATVRVQSVLFRETLAVVQGRLDFSVRFFGLAAFPSLHVGVLTFYALWGRHAGRFWRGAYGAFAGLVLVGSVLTGYHYLVDGLAGAALAWGCYRLFRPAGRP
jgi:membrane-associated phospholipid phosphatase